MSDQDRISPYNINTISIRHEIQKKVKYQFGNNYRNFRPITRAADYSHRSILGSNEKKISTDYPHWQIPRTQKQKKKSSTRTKFLQCFF